MVDACEERGEIRFGPYPYRRMPPVRPEHGQCGGSLLADGRLIIDVKRCAKAPGEVRHITAANFELRRTIYTR